MEKTVDSQMYYHLLEWEKDPGEEMAEVSIVPDNWLVMGTDTCRWPPGRISTTLIRKGPTPQLSWPSFPYTRIVRSTSDWERMLRWQTKFLERSDLETDASDLERSKRRRQPPSYWSRSPSLSVSSASPTRAGSRSRSRSPTTRGTTSNRSLPLVPPPRRRSPSNSPIYPTSQSSHRMSTPRHRHDESLSTATSECTCTPTRPYFDAVLRGQEKVLASLGQLKTEVDGMKKEIRRIVAAQEVEERREEAARPELPQGFEFPLKNPGDLEALDANLKDKMVRKRLERHLYNLGGRDFKDSLRTVGAALLCPDLQGHYNLTGNRKASNKSSFLKLIEVHRTMYNAVFDRHQTDKQCFNTYLSDWLSTWRDRQEGGKKNRVGEKRKTGTDGEIRENNGVEGDRS